MNKSNQVIIQDVCVQEVLWNPTQVEGIITIQEKKKNGQKKGDEEKKKSTFKIEELCEIVFI